MLPRTESGRGTVPGKLAMKSKFVAAYESLFKGEDPSAGKTDFWDELLLLRVNAQFLERCVMLTSEEQLLIMHKQLHVIFAACLTALRDENRFRVIHALETFAVLLRHLSRKKWANFSVDILALISGLDNADRFFREFVANLISLLQADKPADIKGLALHVLLVVTTASDNINQNTMIPYLLTNDAFDALIQLLIEPSQFPLHHVVLLLAVLCNYHKYEAKNLFHDRLSEISQPVIIETLVSVTAAEFARQCTEFTTALDNAKRQTSRWFSWTPATPVVIGPSVDAGLSALILYELAHSNRAYFNQMIDIKRTIKSNDTPAAALQVPGLKLFSSFLSFSSFIFLHLKDSNAINYGRLCLIILQYFAESDVANNLLHDTKLNLPVALFQRQKHNEVVLLQRGKTEPLVVIVFDLMVDFMRQNLKKNLPAELYMKALSIVHAILCYEKKFRIRVQYRWKDIWTALFAIMRQVSNEDLFAKSETKALSSRIATIFNFFITYGDTFLASPSDYDDLYYELIRLKPTIDAFYQKAYEYDKQVSAELDNILTIVNHFTARLDAWSIAHPDTPLSPALVVSIIKGNYESLKLHLLDGLDQYEAYLENPKESTFFRQLLRGLVFEHRHNLELKLLDVGPQA